MYNAAIGLGWFQSQSSLRTKVTRRKGYMRITLCTVNVYHINVCIYLYLYRRWPRNAECAPVKCLTATLCECRRNEVTCFQYLGTRARMNDPSLVNCAAGVVSVKIGSAAAARHRVAPPRMNSQLIKLSFPTVILAYWFFSVFSGPRDVFVCSFRSFSSLYFFFFSATNFSFSTSSLSRRPRVFFNTPLSIPFETRVVNYDLPLTSTLCAAWVCARTTRKYV